MSKESRIGNFRMSFLNPHSSPASPLSNTENKTALQPNVSKNILRYKLCLPFFSF